MAHHASTGPLSNAEFSVPSIVCDGCAERVRDALMALPGIREVKPSLWRKRILVRYEPSKVREEQIKDALGAAGFETADS